MNKETGAKAVSPLNGVALPPGPGRPKGSINKLSRTAKDNIQAVFDALGGVKGMTTWAKRSPRHMEAFYRDIYPKILALETKVEHSGEVSGILTFMFGENGNGKEGHE